MPLYPAHISILLKGKVGYLWYLVPVDLLVGHKMEKKMGNQIAEALEFDLVTT